MDTLEEVAALFRVLMHPTRLAILAILRAGEQCVCHMEATLGLRQAYISQHLIVLRDAGLVSVRRDGWSIYYRVTRPEIFSVIDAASLMMTQGDQERAGTSAIAPRPGACSCPKCSVRLASRWSCLANSTQ